MFLLKRFTQCKTSTKSPTTLIQSQPLISATLEMQNTNKHPPK